MSRNKIIIISLLLVVFVVILLFTTSAFAKGNVDVGDSSSDTDSDAETDDTNGGNWNWYDEVLGSESEGDSYDGDIFGGTPNEYGSTGAAVSFSIAAQKVLNVEGGYTDNALDNGNWTGCKANVGNLVGTNHGISACTFKDYYGYTPTAQDMQNLNVSDALAIYNERYWNKSRIGEMNNQPVANISLDTVVQHGNSKGGKLIQKALNSLGHNLWVDGIIGNKTLAAINTTNAPGIYQAIKIEREAEYRAKAIAQPYFLQGWLNRLNTFNEY